MDVAVRSSAEYMEFKIAVLEAEKNFNRATLTEFKGRMITTEIDAAVDSYVRARGHLDLAIGGTDAMLSLVRARGCLSEFDTALANRLEEAGVNQLKRVSRESMPIDSIETALFVQRSEFQTLRAYLTDAIQATSDFEDEIADGVFVATLLGEPNKLKTAKGVLEYGIRTVTDLLAVTTHSTAVALEDIFPLGSEFLLEPKKESRTVLPTAIPSATAVPTKGGGNGCSAPVGQTTGTVPISWLLIGAFLGLMLPGRIMFSRVRQPR